MEKSNRLEELISKYERTLFRAALAILGDAPEAEDAVQDAFLRYLEKRPDFPDEGRERAWFLKVTANGCKSRLRARTRRPVLRLTEEIPASEVGGCAVVEAVLGLKEKERAVVHLYYYEGYSTDEIAAILGERPGTVRSRLSRARSALREMLKGDIEL